MIVEVEPFTREVAEIVLQDAGHEVTTSTNCQKAVDS